MPAPPPSVPLEAAQVSRTIGETQTAESPPSVHFSPNPPTLSADELHAFLVKAHRLGNKVRQSTPARKYGDASRARMRPARKARERGDMAENIVE